jgi:hypothetical protein
MPFATSGWVHPQRKVLSLPQLQCRRWHGWDQGSTTGQHDGTSRCSRQSHSALHACPIWHVNSTWVGEALYRVAEPAGQVQNGGWGVVVVPLLVGGWSKSGAAAPPGWPSRIGSVLSQESGTGGFGGLAIVPGMQAWRKDPRSGAAIGWWWQRTHMSHSL